MFTEKTGECVICWIHYQKDYSVRMILSNLRGDLPASVLSSYANAENLTDWFLVNLYFVESVTGSSITGYRVVTNVENFVSKESSYSVYGC